MCNPTKDDNEKVVFSEEDLKAMREVRTKLLEDHGIEESRVGPKFLAMATIICKLRVDQTCTKLVNLLKILQECQCPEGISDEWIPEAAHEFASYQPAGTNFSGTSVMWIKGGRSVPTENERHHCQASSMFTLAVHADSKSLRDGITMVFHIPASQAKKKVGNESKMQKMYQSYPSRPQSILIAGTSTITRAVVNASIKIASLFSKQKVLDRIKFVTIEDAKAAIPSSSVPKYIGGVYEADIEQWVRKRIEDFPTPEL